MPSFAVFIGFLGPLLGIALGFDAINTEQNKGTLSRLLSQPIYRDYILNAKWIAALFVIGIMLFALGFLVMGFGLIFIGIPPTAEEFCRIVLFLLLSMVYIALWLNLALFFSIKSKQPATSALSGIAVWLFFSLFYNIIMNVVGKALSPSPMAMPDQVVRYQKFMLNLLRYHHDHVDAFGKESWTTHIRTDGWCYPKSPVIGTKFACGMASTHRIDLHHAPLFYVGLHFIYEERGTIEVTEHRYFFACLRFLCIFVLN